MPLARDDALTILQLLLSFGADPNQRGINDYTPLHLAAAEGLLEAVELLLAAGADPRLRTRIDDYETPRELAESAGHIRIAKRLATAEQQLELANRK
jgi:ankyrin repeat protein